MPNKMINDINKLGIKVRTARTKLNWSMEYLSEKSNVSRSTIANFEVGRFHGISLINVMKIYKALGLNLQKKS